MTNHATATLKSVSDQIERVLGDTIRLIVSEEADKAAESVRKRVNKLVAETALNVAQFYEVEYQQGRIVIEIRGVPKADAPQEKP